MTRPSPRPIVWTDELLARFWSYHAQTPELYFSHRCGRALLARIRSRLPADRVVLDYGCGPGYMLRHLLDAGFRAAGADFSLAAVGAASPALTGEPGFEGVATVDAFVAAGRRFGAVLLLEVVEHLDDDRLSACFANVRRLLEPGGLLVVTTPNEEDLAAETVYCPVADVTFHRWQHVRSWSAASLRDCLVSFGFRPDEIFTEDFGLLGDGSWQAGAKRLLRRAGLTKSRDPSLVALSTLRP